MHSRYIIDFFSIGPCQGVLGKFVNDMWTKSWFTKESIGTFLFADISIINSNSVSYPIIYPNIIHMYMYIYM